MGGGGGGRGAKGAKPSYVVGGLEDNYFFPIRFIVHNQKSNGCICVYVYECVRYFKKVIIHPTILKLLMTCFSVYL